MTICVRIEELEVCHYQAHFRKQVFIDKSSYGDALFSYSGEMFSIDPKMCFNVERVPCKSRTVCCGQTPSAWSLKDYC